MAARSFIGTWEVESCVIQGNNDIKSGLEGTKFVLDDTGDVTWCPENEESAGIPLFSCETYEIYSTNMHEAIIRFGAYAEHIIEFRAEPSEPQDSVVLSCDGWCVLQCIRIVCDETDNSPNEEFSLLPAVEDGFFSDMVVEAQDNRQFHVHSSILGLLGTDMSWMTDPPPFSGLPEGVVGSILHWLYAECLPSAMTEELAVQVIEAVKEYPCMSKLVHDCNEYLKNMALKQQIVDLVSDMHACANQIVEYFNTPGECLGCHPAKLCLVVKQSVRETAVALVKLLLLCELFTKRKGELSREERHEIIRYARSRLPIFMSQLRRLLEYLNITFNSMTHAQRHEVATYIVPEIDAILCTISSLIFDVKIALEYIMQALSPADGGETSNPPTEQQTNTSDDALGKSLRDVFRIRELSKLRNFHKKVAFSLMHLLYKKESFAGMTESNRVRSVSRNLDQLIEELPIFFHRLEEVTTAMDDRLQWREFKFCFRVATSKVSGILNKFILHRDSLHDVIMRLSSLVQREAFTLGLVSLGLLTSPAQVAESSEMGEGQTSEPEKNHQPKNQHKPHGFKLNLVDTLMKPPPISNSNLSKAAGKLLKSERFADMVFEIPVQTPIQACARSATETSIASKFLPQKTLTSQNTLPEKGDPLPLKDSAYGTIEENGSVIMKAHRVIVAARCVWFRRALQSGMKEAIHRRIVIYDTSPAIFRKLLAYLYTGKLDTRIATGEQLIELVLLGDRYELDAMKQACERALALRHLDRDTSFYYLNIADQYNAAYLKDACIRYIISRTGLTDCELFSDLPRSLQTEVLSSSAAWTPAASRPRVWEDGHLDQETLEALLESTVIDEGSNSECSSVEEISIDRTRLNDCLARLRDVLGPHVALDELNRIALAADCDANRAVNFYYSQSHSSPDES